MQVRKKFWMSNSIKVPPKVILHAGMTKAGSTALQNKLDSVYFELIELGYLFPRSLLTRKDPTNPLRTSGHFSLFSQLEKGDLRNFENELLKHTDSIHTLILSAEGIFQIDSTSKLEMLKNIFGNAHISLVAVLRSQDSWLQSRYFESVSKGFFRETASLDEFCLDQLNEGNLNYLASLEKLERTLRPSEMLVWDHARTNNAGGLVQKFFHHFNIPVGSDVEHNAGNASNPFPEGLEAHRQLNKSSTILPGQQYRIFCDQMRRLCRDTQERYGLADEWPVPSIDVRRKVLEACEPTNHRISELYFGGTNFGPKRAWLDLPTRDLDQNIVSLLLENGRSVLMDQVPKTAEHKRNALEATESQFETDFNKSKVTVPGQKRKHKRFRKLAILLFSPILLLLSPILLPMLAIRKLRRLRRQGLSLSSLIERPSDIFQLFKGQAIKADRVLKSANEIALAGNHTKAIETAAARLPPKLAYSINILKANAAVAAGDTEEWQRHVNAYLSTFGVAPIILEGEGSVFDRLSTATLPRTATGPLVSVIMPAWNAEKTVSKAVLSILNQTWLNLELIIVDDCSTDETWTILKQLAADDHRVRILRNSVNVGPYASKNIATTQARGNWITGHDADDWAHPERLERQIKFCESEGLKVCLSGMLRISADGEFVRLNPIGGFVHDGACRSGLISLMIKTHYLRDVLGGWDLVRTSGDSELLRRIEALEKKPVRQLASVTMFCLDNPDGLTNDPKLGYNETSGVSNSRKLYRASFEEWHKSLDRKSARLDIFSSKRPFVAPAEIVSNLYDVDTVLGYYREAGLELTKSINVDAIIITNARFPGGNASSSIDELRWFKDSGMTFALVHCPTDVDIGKDISSRFDPYLEHVYNWTELGQVHARFLICRHPSVVTSEAFKKISSKISAENAFIVVNNSSHRPNGAPVYRIDDLFDSGKNINSPNITFCPISQVIREELEACSQSGGTDVKFSTIDWTPTFDLSLYHQKPKPEMLTPFHVGRHGRDGREKWLEVKSSLGKVYPNDADFKISILGGAKTAKEIFGKLPENWKVHEFGDIEPYEYLSELDVFVYFPHTALIEAFGRTIVEAMLAGIPVIIPRRFEITFGELPLYCEPNQVADLIRQLAKDNKGRISYLREVQDIAVCRYSSEVIKRRLTRDELLNLGESNDLPKPVLSSESRDFRRHLIESSSKSGH
jgi:glycosyltransferase involved in cell wall biosynthesis